MIRPSSLGKRGVSFSHLRHSSVGSGHTAGPSSPQYTPEQRRFLNRRSQDSAVPSLPSSNVPSPYTAPRLSKPAASPAVPRLRVRKPESPSKYIQSEARKVSTELEKVMEEAFNRSSISESIRTSNTDPIKDHSAYDTPPTSISNRNSDGSLLATPPSTKMMLNNRPLPPIPNETPNTFLQRKLAETRADIAHRAAQAGDNTAHFNDILAKLDNLMDPSMNVSQRASSAPTKSPEHAGLLPVISEEAKIDGEDRYEHYNMLPNRAVTDPLRPNLQGRRALTEQTTIRVVDQSPTPIAPLNIRKRSGASTKSRGDNHGLTVPWPDSMSNVPGRSYQGVQTESLVAKQDIRPATTPSQVGVPGQTDATVKKKKSSWFRRNPEEKDRQEKDRQEVKPKPSIGRLQIPEAWQGLDDRMEKAPPASPGVKHTVKHSNVSASSEFPMRPSDDVPVKPEGTKERKGFLGLFGKKVKEDKGKRAMEIGCEYSDLMCFSYSGKCSFSLVPLPLYMTSTDS